MPRKLEELRKTKPNLIFGAVDTLHVPDALKKTITIFISGTTGQTPLKDIPKQDTESEIPQK
jgi:hypothetical protein